MDTWEFKSSTDQQQYYSNLSEQAERDIKGTNIHINNKVREVRQPNNRSACAYAIPPPPGPTPILFTVIA